MGLDPASMTGMLTLMGVNSGLGAAAGALGGNGQELNSFEGTGRTDPKESLGRAAEALETVFQGALAQAAKPVELSSAFVQSPTNFSGFGLPFPVGVAGRDPALFKPEMLSLPGIDFGGLGGQGGGEGTAVPRVNRRSPEAASGQNTFNTALTNPGASLNTAIGEGRANRQQALGARRRQTRAQTDDSAQAAAAISLLGGGL